ncbi:hypothetical protein RB195_000495 [Necator americanus]
MNKLAVCWQKAGALFLSFFLNNRCILCDMDCKSVVHLSYNIQKITSCTENRSGLGGYNGDRLSLLAYAKPDLLSFPLSSSFVTSLTRT